LATHTKTCSDPQYKATSDFVQINGPKQPIHLQGQRRPHIVWLNDLSLYKIVKADYN